MSAEGHKLRGSCHACAMSKVRCSKDKPICSRCSKRGTTCEYLITKRLGRKQLQNRPTPNASDSNTTTASLATVPQGLPESDPVSTALPLADQPPLSVPGTTPSSLDVFSSLFDSVEGSWSLPLTDWDTDVDEYLTRLAMPRTAHPEPLDAEGRFDSTHSTSSGSPARPPSDFAMPVMPPGDTISLFGRPALGSRASPGPRSQRADSAGQHRPPSSCACLSHALDLMKGMAISDPRDGRPSGGPRRESAGGRRSIDATIQANQQTMDEIHTLLQCGCSEDSYLQAIVALIVFKALDRYATAAAEPVLSVDRDELQIEGEAIVSGAAAAAAAADGRLSAAQRVLSELYRVQRVVNQLSQRSTASPARTPQVPGKNASSAVSTTVMGHMERELRKQLGTLSSEIIKMLQLAE